MSAQPHEWDRMWPAPQRVVWGSPDAAILSDWGHAVCAICAKAATEPARGMSAQPHEDPRWDCGPEALRHRAIAERAARAAADMEDLQGEALRRAWLDAGYRVRQEPPVSGRALAVAIPLAVACWAIIGAIVWIVWFVVRVAF